MKLQSSKSSGFTLAEILIALGLLGVIAAFTIPKVLQSTGSSRSAAVFKETAAAVAGAFSTYTLNNTLAAANHFGTFTTNATTGSLNFVRESIATDVMTAGTGGTAACSATNPCIVTHMGSWIQYSPANTFGGTAATNGVQFAIDPDGAGSTAPVQMYLYANGRITTVGSGATVPTSGAGYTGVANSADPAYVNNWS